MRDLPDRANLDHLRRQAKDQLAVLRRTDPAATLADAQASLAGQYGFEGWADLKDEVARRAAAPPLVAAPGVAERLAAAFGLGRPSPSADPAGAGAGAGAGGPMTHVERQWTGHLWNLTTDEGRWTATALADFVASAHIETEAAFVERAIAVGVHAPAPVCTTTGAFVHELDGVRWRVHRWTPLGPPLPQPPPPPLAVEGGRVLARIHGLDVRPPEPVVPWLTYRHGQEHWGQIVDAARSAGRPWADDLAAAVPGLLALDAVRDLADPNPRAILSKAWHAPAGARPAGGGRLVTIGWEHTSAVPKDWDLGASLMAWSGTDEDGYDATAARAFLDGYRELAGDVAVTLPMFTSGVTNELNWMISRANIALHEDDPVERDIAERNIRTLVRHPLRLDAVERLAAALAPA